VALGSPHFPDLSADSFWVISHVQRAPMIQNRALSSADEEAINALRATPLFKNIPPDILRILAASLEEFQIKGGEPIFLENEMSQYIYFVKSGAVEIVRFYPSARQILRLAMIRSGGHFSELSVLTQTSHSSSAFALENSVLYRLHSEDFFEFMAKNVGSLRAMVEVLAQLNGKLLADFNHVEYVKDEAFVFHPQMPNLITNALILRHQVLPVALYGKTLQVAQVNPQNRGFIDDFKLVHPDFKLKITAIAAERVSWQERELSSSPKGSEVSLENVKNELKNSQFFSLLPDSIFDQILPHLEIKWYGAQEKIFQAGSPSRALYFVYGGSVDLTNPLGSGRSNCVSRIGKGGIFSEVSLILQRAHALDATAFEDTILVSCSAEIFSKLLNVNAFSLPIARLLVHRLQESNSIANLQPYAGDRRPAFEKVAHLLPLQLMQDQAILPLELVENELTIGVINPENDFLYFAIHRHLASYRVRLQMISKLDYDRWILAVVALVQQKSSSAVGAASQQRLQLVRSGADLAKLAEDVIQLGYSHRASDIHIEPQQDDRVIRYRIDGTLHELTSRMNHDIGERLVNRIKILSTMDISEVRQPQDGQLRTRIGEVAITARVSTVPTRFGENLVMRLIRPHQTVIPLNMLVPDKRAITALQQMIRFKQGMILVSGPTGSGKTTTLYSILSELNRAEKNIITVEDPIEASIPGLTQIEVNAATGLTFSKALRHILRQDPDIIMAGEIRDPESAKIAFQAALTGHLVLATLHTNHSLDVAARLRDLEVTPSAISSGIVWSLSQRLLRTLCLSCKKPIPTSPEEALRFVTVMQQKEVPRQIMKAMGCSRCHGTGYYERIPVFEYWRNTPDVTSALLSGASIEVLREAIYKDGFQNLIQFGTRMVSNGLTTFDEVDRCLFGLNY
jgi:type II secretory ATPase GspE/PulE/Tfp pilus assembly ATPase PilB-like protein